MARSAGVVARLIEHGQSDGHGYEVLEYLPQGSLRSRLATGPLAEEQARALVVELSAALALLHEHDILHRDLKPENVLIRQWQPLRIALTDFGIASVAEATQHFESHDFQTVCRQPAMRPIRLAGDVILPGTTRRLQIHRSSAVNSTISH